MGRTKAVKELELAREKGEDLLQKDTDVATAFKVIHTIAGSEDATLANTEIGSVIYANKPGDGSAREQAASCQRVIGGLANITREYATKRYRSNVINWGMLPFHLKDETIAFDVNDFIFVPSIKKVLAGSMDEIPAYVLKEGKAKSITLYILPLNEEEKEIIKAGCLINFNRSKNK